MKLDSRVWVMLWAGTLATAIPPLIAGLSAYREQLPLWIAIYAIPLLAAVSAGCSNIASFVNKAVGDAQREGTNG
jgi:hypothetical protein